MKSIEEIKADYQMFVDIQMGKYLKSVNQSTFKNKKEADLVMGKIVGVYNEEIAPEHFRLDNLNKEAKATWFNSVEIDFGIKENIDPIKEIPALESLTNQLVSYYDEIFYFLPKNAIIYLLFAGPALEAYGYSLERFQKLIEGEEATEIEEDLLLWAYEIAFGVMAAYLEKDKNKKENQLLQIIEIAKEELDEKTALDVVANIYADIENDFHDNKISKKKPFKKNKMKK